MGSSADPRSPLDEAITELINASADEDVDLGVFTDEELVGLDGIGTAPHLPSPWYESLSESQREIALSAALRGLSARGLYAAHPVDEATGEIQWEMAAELRATLALRQRGERLVSWERTTTRGVDWLIAIRHDQATWLCESIAVTGYHALVMSHADRVAERVSKWLSAEPHVAAVFDRVLPSGATPTETATVLAPMVDCLSAVTASAYSSTSEVGGELTPDAAIGFYTGPTANFLSEPTAEGTRYWSATQGEFAEAITRILGTT